MDEKRYLALLDATVDGNEAEADRLVSELASEERRTDAAARNRALLGSETAAQRNRARVGRPRGPRGEAS